MTVYFDTTIFIDSESSGNITISMNLIRNAPDMSGEITVMVIPSNQLPLSAEGKRCVSYTD